jgi:hypothetical protein
MFMAVNRCWDSLESDSMSGLSVLLLYSNPMMLVLLYHHYLNQPSFLVMSAGMINSERKFLGILSNNCGSWHCVNRGSL